MLSTFAIALMIQAAPTVPVGPPPPPPTLARAPRPIEPGSWVTQDDYPVGALATNQQGVVGFRVQVGLDGTVSECAVTQPSGWPLLDEMTCALIAVRARFTPATDARGGRVRGTYSNRIRWQLPPPVAPVVPPAPGR
jgi:periplasmic protein TonB